MRKKLALGSWLLESTASQSRDRQGQNVPLEASVANIQQGGPPIGGVHISQMGKLRPSDKEMVQAEH